MPTKHVFAHGKNLSSIIGKPMQFIVPRVYTLTGLSFSGLLFEWGWMKEKRAAATELQRLLPTICELLDIDINDNVKIWIHKHGALDAGSFYTQRTQQISISLAEIDFILPRIDFFQELRREFEGYNVNWHAFTLAHELAHHSQHTKGMLGNGALYVRWWGNYYNIMDYERHYDKPWEIDANERAKKVIWGLIERGLM